MDYALAQLKQLGEFTRQSVLTEAEFAQQKSRSPAPDAGTAMS